MEISRSFPEIKGKLGFGCMRLPMKDGAVDAEQFSAMADAFIEAGFNYFDTAHGYINGMSETAIRDCVAARRDRSEFLLTDKLTDEYFKTQSDIRPFVKRQLELCGVEYFDFYLMHAQNRNNYKKFRECRAYETALELKKEGLIRHFGISFHDKAEVLDTILTENPAVEVVQIQFNYVDYDDASVESKKVYEVCEKHGKPVIVMEPVKGGSLVRLPEKADSIFRALNGGSNASYALRFAASFPNMAVVLSGMSDMAQMTDNVSSMRDFRPLDPRERGAVSEVCAIFKSLDLVPCTACRYCVEQNHCPKEINIPAVFAALNSFEAFHSWNASFYYRRTVDGSGRASDCIKCGKCERVCPQRLPIRDLLVKASAAFDGANGDDD